MKAQGEWELGIFAEKMLKVITTKIKEAEHTRKVMKPTIKRDFGINLHPDDFKNFLIDNLEELGKFNQITR